MQKHVVGIDVSKKTLDVCAIFDGKLRKQSFDNSNIGFRKLVDWTVKLKLTNPHFCMEATGCYSEPVAEFLLKAGCMVSIVNPLPVKSFRTSRMIRQKTDRSDAELIANYCLHNDPRIWRPRKPECKQLHEANSFLDSLKLELNRLNNQLEKSYENDRVKKSITDRIDFTKKQIQDLENEAEQVIMSSSELKRNFEIITSIKGVGKRLACAILADTCFERFENGKQFAAFAGVTPSHFESGTSIKGRSRISRIGSSKLRKILYMNALVVKNRNEYFVDFVRKLQEKGKAAKVIIVAIMRKLMCVIYGMLKSQQKFDKKFAFPD